MEIRDATEDDIPDIVALLKISLGESLMPKSERYWRWKHIENPFGPSPVLLCWEGSTLIGVRAFMRWEWIMQGRVFRSVRAVDTATHPDHQGKGIFKKLTLSLVERCKEEGDHFVFNTPNNQSRPGYLKMGWVEAGKLPIFIGIRRPFAILKNRIAPTFPALSELTGASVMNLNYPDLPSLLSAHQQRERGMVTNITADFLKWRYLDVPVTKYIAVVEQNNNEVEGLIIGRIKNSGMGMEMRVTDYFMRNDQIRERLIGRFRQKVNSLGIHYVSLSGTNQRNRTVIPGLSIKLPIGPAVTIRSLYLDEMDPLINFSKWNPSLGDLELF